MDTQITTARPVPGQLTLEEFRNLPQVPGHRHDEACSVGSPADNKPDEDSCSKCGQAVPPRPRHQHNAYCYMSEALWQVGWPTADQVGLVAAGLENELNPALALGWLEHAMREDADAIAAVPNGPVVVAAVADALRRMADGA